MKIYVMTDLECVAGVVNFVDYCRPENSRYYERARELLTQEVNAAVEGLVEGGATEVLIADGHGPGGLDVAAIHPAASVLTGRPADPPLGLDGSFDAAIMIGQHAKANTDGGHLCHSGSFNRQDWLLNGLSIGEIALVALQAGYFGVPTVMLSGDRAACDEARALVPSIETVAVIEGQCRGSSSGISEEENKAFNVAAVHMSPPRARQMIREGARRCLARVGEVERFWIEPPYEMVRLRRGGEHGPLAQAINRADDLIVLLRQQAHYEPVTPAPRQR